MWLEVQASVPSDPSATTPFFQSGAWDAATGVLTRDAQLKIYEVALGRAGATMEPYPTQFHFVTNQIVFQDNRIPPAGFDTTNVKFDEMAPVPASLYPPTTANGTILQHWDDSSYTIAIPATATGDVQVTVSLLYQTASKDYVDFLQANGPRAGNAVTRGDDIKTVWQNHGKSEPVVMATQTFTVMNTAPFVPILDMAGANALDLSGAVEDMAVPAYDMMIIPNPKKPKHGCGVSVAGADWSDLGPLATLLVAGVLFSRRRRRPGARG
jgi:MYXO-CTERM domain-containing protein